MNIRARSVKILITWASYPDLTVSSIVAALLRIEMMFRSWENQ